MAVDAFFHRDGSRFVPNDIARGPWDRESLHGRLVAGLMAHEIELRFGDPAFQPSRLTVDLYRMPPFAPAQVTARAVRDGKRIRVLDAEFLSEGIPFGRATCVLLRRSENPAGNVWTPPQWDVPPPEALPGPPADASRCGTRASSAADSGAWSRSEPGFGRTGRLWRGRR